MSFGPEEQIGESFETVLSFDVVERVPSDDFSHALINPVTLKSLDTNDVGAALANEMLNRRDVDAGKIAFKHIGFREAGIGVRCREDESAVREVVAGKSRQVGCEETSLASKQNDIAELQLTARQKIFQWSRCSVHQSLFALIALQVATHISQYSHAVTSSIQRRDPIVLYLIEHADLRFSQ